MCNSDNSPQLSCNDCPGSHAQLKNPNSCGESLIIFGHNVINMARVDLLVESWWTAYVSRMFLLNV